MSNVLPVSKFALKTITAINHMVVAVDGANAPTRESFIKAATELGAHSAAGADSKANLAFTALSGAVAGALDSVKRDEKGNPHKEGLDDAQRLFNAYANAIGKRASHTPAKEMTKGNLAKSYSQLRKFIEAGVLEADEKCEATSVLHRTKEIRAAAKVEGKAVDDAFEVYYRAMIALGRAVEDGRKDLTDDEIGALVLKPTREARTIQQRVDGVRGTISNIVDDCEDEALKVALQRAMAEIDRAVALIKAGAK